MNDGYIVKPKRHKNTLPTSILPPQEDHELVYCFAKKTPEYDVSSHSELTNDGKVYDKNLDGVYGNPKFQRGKTHKDPLPTSILPPQEDHELVYCFAQKTPEYDVSSHLTGKTYESTKEQAEIYGKMNDGYIVKETKDPLPTSILPPQEDHELVYCFAQKTPEYDVSSHLTGEEVEKPPTVNDKFLKEAGFTKGRKCHKLPHKSKVLKEPLPNSVLPPQDIPSSWCKYKLDEGINHRTSKPVKLMEFLLKYWSKESDTILDPTAGSGSMGCSSV